MRRKVMYFFAIFACVLCSVSVSAKAAGTKGLIEDGVYAGSLSLGGLTSSQAVEKIRAYVEELTNKEITLRVDAETERTLAAGELGLHWNNPELITEAMSFGASGNVIERYKAKKELQENNQILELKLGLNEGEIRSVLESLAEEFDREPVEASLSRKNDEFIVIPGESGRGLAIESSLQKIFKALLEEWNHDATLIALEVEERTPLHSEEELSKVTDVLGSYTTSFSGSAAGRVANVSNGCAKVNGITVYPGEEVSVHDLMAPYTAKNGYDLAGAYISGRVVDVVGGGVCQVSTTLYNAILLAELEVVERHNHSMTVSYVPVSADAAMAESSGKDFRFANNTEYPIYIEGYTTDKNKITFNVYGHETRDPSRTVRYESEILEVIPPAADVIYTNDSLPVGYLVTEGSHTGYKSRLWKIVTVDGVEQPKELVNKSNYKQSPRMATVGTGTTDPVIREQIMAAVASGNIDTIKATVGAINAAAAGGM